MRRKNALPELLAPAGDMQALFAAIEAGADAVYLGGKRFGARAFAKNFDDEELALAARYCHLHGVRLYVTVNTLVFDKELGELSDYAAFLYEAGVDAVIVADLGAVSVIKERAPELEIHASTQMSVHNTAGADMAARLGCSRVVVARELPLSDIIEITEGCPIETEVFLHGALCVCHSGQCLFSSLVGGRSGNRGECAQPCRLPYNGGYPLSLSDLSLAAHVTELIDSGTASLKIEGRMKSPDYVYSVVKIYRRLLDERRNATPEEHKALSRIFSRGGFTDGYFTGKPFSRMTGVRSEEDKSQTKELSGRVFSPIKREVSAEARFKIGEPCELTLTLGERTVKVYGSVVREAISAPLDEASLKKRLSKMGNTFLSLAEENIKIELDRGANLSPGEINALRRAATDAVEMGERRMASAPNTFWGRKTSEERIKSALFLSENALLGLSRERLLGFDLCFAPLFASNEAFELANGVYLPPVLRNRDFERVKKRLAELKNMGVLYTLVGNLGAVGLSLDAGLEPVGDFRFNVTNVRARGALALLGVSRTVLSAELDLPKARDVGGSVIVYGRIPLMLTERCFVKENFSCSECGRAKLVDRRGKAFPIIREYEHRNLILNSEITYMADRLGDVSECSLSEHYVFSVESSKEVEALISAFKKGAPIERVFSGQKPRRVGMRRA